MIFAQRYRKCSDVVLSDPWLVGPDSDRAYLTAAREWFHFCRDCRHVTAYPSWRSAHHADDHHVCGTTPPPSVRPIGEQATSWTADEDAVLTGQPRDLWDTLLPRRTWRAILTRASKLRAAGHPIPRMTSGPKPPPGSKPRKPPLKGSKPCPFPDCHRPIRARGLCSPHYRQQLAGKKLTVLRDWRPAA